MATAGFNATYYVQTYTDVLLALSRGVSDFKTAEEHFEKYGAKEGRNPNANFDSTYYLANNPDVLNAVRAGIYASAYDHFIKNGGKEGRIPSAALANFNGAAYLAANNDLTGKYTAANVVEHYVLYGAAEGRSGGTAQQVTGNYVGTTADDTVTPAGGQASTVRVEGGQQGAKGDTLIITSGSAASFQLLNLSNDADQNQTRDNSNNNNGGNKIGPVVQGFENVDATAATINMNITALDRTSITNTGSAAPTITGSVILGGTGRDTLAGAGGNDSISGGDGNDVITGGAGADTLSGGLGNDNIDGGAGADVISDGLGDDTVNGGAGNDTINVDGGTNFVDGGSDDDTITLKADQGTATAASTIQGGSGNDKIVLNDAAITAASRVSVTGGVGHDTITAGLGVETINGGSGNDTIIVTQANIGTADVFNGNDGQDIIQLQIPTGSAAGTYTFTPGASQFSGFEAIALVDSTGNTSAKSYKIVLTDNFVANNVVGGSFLIDGRGLPGGSNIVIDFSQLTSTSAAAFVNSGFRVLTSPTTVIRDQNNNTITGTYAVNTTNSALNAITAFNVYNGETAIVAGTDAAYTTDRLVATGSGQATYTTQSGTPEGTPVSGSSYDFTLLATGQTLTNAYNSGTTSNSVVSGISPNGSVLSAASNSINAGTFLSKATIIDTTVGDGDRLDAILTTDISAAADTATVVGIETINLTSYAAGKVDLSKFSGVTSFNVTGQSFAGTNIANGQTLNLSNIATGGTVNVAPAAAGIASATLNLNNVATSLVSGATANLITTLNLVNTGSNTLTIGADAINGTNGGTLAISGSGSLSISDSDANGQTTINASAFTGALTYTQAATLNASVTGGSGNDTFAFTSRLTTADTVNGGAGTDTLTVSASNAATDIDNVTGVETVTLAAGANYTYTVTASSAQANDSTLVTLNAGALASGNTLNFNGANTTQHGYVITGGADADTISGSQLADTITGGAGADLLIGGRGNDNLTGGSGSDTFAFGSTDAAGTDLAVANVGVDTITDFVAGASGDILRFDQGGLGLTNATLKVATLSSGGGTLTSIANTAMAADVDVVILLNTTGFANYAAAQVELNATAGAITDATNGAVVLWYSSADGKVHMTHDTNISAGAGTGTEIGIIGNSTSAMLAAFTSANFAGIA